MTHRPRPRNCLPERPEVIEAAKRDVHLGEDVAARCQLVAGNFFESVHDWDDEQCVRILSNCSRASSGTGRVLMVDTVVPPGNDPHWSKLLDINMLVLTGGRERSRDDFVRLLARAGLRLQRIVPTACPLSILEGVAA